MRTNKMQYMRPGEITAEMEQHSIAYLPIGPLEWHSYHMPYGTDPLAAEQTALRAAAITGGIVLPTLYFGTEKKCSKEMMESLGFEDTNQYIEGMDYPKNTLKSFYAREEAFALIVREYLRMMTEFGFKLVVLVNGHAANGQMAALDRLVDEFDGKTDSHVIQFLSLHGLREDGSDVGHAAILETAVQMALNEDNVDLMQLPPRNVKLKYIDWGIADMGGFIGNPSPDHTVQADPRDASVQLGEQYLELYTEKLVELVTKEYPQ